MRPTLATGLVGEIDQALGNVDSVLAMWKVRNAREAAWTNGEVLWHLRPAALLRREFLARLDSMTGFASRGLLLPALGIAVWRITGRLEALQSIQAQLERADWLKDDLYQHLTQIQGIEREAFERHQEAELLLEQCSARWKHVDERRADLAVVEQSIAGVDGRIRKLERLTDGLDSKISVIADRDRVVDAVKHEIEAVHEIARRCHDDLGAIADQRAAITQTRDDVDRLASALAAADEKLLEVERRSAAVEDVRRKADAVVQLLDDVRVTLDTVGEQKAVADHVTEMLAQFEDAITEARGTTRALQAERKLAQRIVENVRHIHGRAGVEAGQPG